MAMKQPLLGAEEVRGIHLGKKARVAASMFMVLGLAAYVYGCVALPPPQPAALRVPLQLAATGGVGTEYDLHITMTDPNVMLAKYGFVPLPVLGLTGKGFFTFMIQLVFFFGGTMFEGFQARQEKMNKPMKEFSKLSIAFQVLGQASAAASYLSLAKATTCWNSWEEMRTFLYLISQHNGSVTIIVGLANNIIVRRALSVNPEQEEVRGRRAATVLIFTGALIGLPLWGALLVAAFSLQAVNVAAALAGSVWCCGGAASVKERILEFRPTAGNPLGDVEACMSIALLGAAALTLLWLLEGLYADAWHALLLLGAAVFELFLPSYFLDDRLCEAYDIGWNATGRAMLNSFLLSLVLAYLATMVVPAAFEEQTGYASFGDAAIVTFWAKKVGMYFQVTFFYPAVHKLDIMNGVGREWFGQVVSFFG